MPKLLVNFAIDIPEDIYGWLCLKGGGIHNIPGLDDVGLLPVSGMRTLAEIITRGVRSFEAAPHLSFSQGDTSPAVTDSRSVPEETSSTEEITAGVTAPNVPKMRQPTPIIQDQMIDYYIAQREHLLPRRGSLKEQAATYLGGQNPLEEAIAEKNASFDVETTSYVWAMEGGDAFPETEISETPSKLTVDEEVHVVYPANVSGAVPTYSAELMKHVADHFLPSELADHMEDFKSVELPKGNRKLDFLGGAFGLKGRTTRL